MHNEILSQKQSELIPLVSLFAKDFGLVGGTAIALHLGHRRSIDFDLFTFFDFGTQQIRNRINEHHLIQSTIIDRLDELTVVVEGVRMTFYKYPYKVNFSETVVDNIRIPDLLTLASMKAFALGRRAKWKDYVDLYFILKSHTLVDVTNKSKEIFGNEFNERLLREQLAYFDDIDYSEQVDYMPGFEVPDDVIKKFLLDLSTKEK